MAQGREMETVIRISGELDESLKRTIEQVGGNIEQIERAAKAAAGATGQLTSDIRDQEKALKKAKMQYASYVLQGEESSEAAQALAQEIKDLNRDLKSNKSALDAAERATAALTEETEDAINGLEDLGREAEDSKGGFTIMKGALADLIARGLTAFIGACADAARGMWGLSESTREYREDIGKLETAWQSAGKTTELATDTYKRFYSVLGEEDRSVEAVNHLAKFVNSEKDMAKWTDIATGVWGTFGDSLPIEGLTEAANEVSKSGKLTGVLVDALVWAGIEEEAFQKKLDGLNSEQERAKLITETLSKTYSKAAENYKKNNKTIIDARLAQSDYTDSLAELGERVEPITTEVTRGLNRVLEKALELTQDVDFVALGNKIDGAFDYLIETIIPKGIAGIEWIIEHKDGIIAIGSAIAVVTGALGVMNGVLAIQSAIMAANPTTWIIMAIIAAVGLLIYAGIKLYKNWDTVKEKAAELGEFLSEKWNSIKEGVSGFIDTVKETFTGGFSDIYETVTAPFEKISEYIDGISSKVSGLVGKVTGKGKEGWFKLPAFAAGGFTNGMSIAGEAGVEAVISFNPAYRDENISYWAKAGRMLGVTAADADFSLSGSSSGGTVVDMGGVTFAPNITVSGNADKDSIVKAIESEYPEFLDLLEKWLFERGLPVYA